MAAGKQYGLILSGKKSNPALRAKLSIFGDDDDEDEPQSVGRTLMKEGMKMKTKKQTQVDIERVLSEDPTAYQYDEVYDNEIAKKKLARKPVIVKETKPKYIDSLLKTAKARQQEYENRIERKVQKEREAEGDEFADKEAFVTTAYRKKMEERQALEDEEKRQAILEAKMDVTKQKDLSGFYRHVLDDLIGNDEKSQEETIQSTSEETQTTTKDNHNVEKSLSHDFSKETKLNKRNIRTRRSSSESSSDEPRRQAEKMDVSKSSPAKKLRERSRTPQSPPSRKRKDKSRSQSPPLRKGRERSRSQSPPSRKGRERSRSQSPPSRKGRERSRSQSPPSRKRRERSRSQSQPQRRRRVRSRSPQRRNRSRSPRRRQRSRSPARRSHHRRQKSRSPYQNRQRKRSTSPQRRERRREKSPHKRQERDRSTERKHSSRRESTNKKSERVVEEKVEETKDEIKENKEQELKMILEKYARRNTEDTIEAARERFFERMKQRGLIKTITAAN